MSLHYLWTPQLELQPDPPAAFLDELRFHIGLSPRPPEHFELGRDSACLLPIVAASGAARSLILHRLGRTRRSAPAPALAVLAGRLHGALTARWGALPLPPSPAFR